MKKRKQQHILLAIVLGNAVQQLGFNMKRRRDREYEEDEDDDETVDHRTLPRAKRKEFQHKDTMERLQHDYLGPEPLFDGKQFEVMFRISKYRFERLMQDIGNSQNPFFLEFPDCVGNIPVSMQAKLLLPLKTMAYGVPPHCFCDYFRMSRTMARECCIMFDKVVKNLYEQEYLRYPTAEDLLGVCGLHKSVHGMDGMLGSLDCMHTYWKNCPVGWQGSYRGKEKKPTIVLEAMADYHMWFWHAAYGYAGTLNDLNILALSPFLEKLIDGSFASMEVEAGVVPYTVGPQAFNQMYILVDGIYPRYTRFVHSIKIPGTRDEEKFSKWQEACRKDIERAFGVLQAKWQCLARPMHQMDLKLIGSRMASCLILHNMCVSDRVMDGDVYARYNPGASILEGDLIEDVEYPNDLLERQGPTDPGDRSTIGGGHEDLETIVSLSRHERWKLMKDGDEYKRLHMALQEKVRLIRKQRKL